MHNADSSINFIYINAVPTVPGSKIRTARREEGVEFAIGKKCPSLCVIEDGAEEKITESQDRSSCLCVVCISLFHESCPQDILRTLEIVDSIHIKKHIQMTSVPRERGYLQTHNFHSVIVPFL